MEGRITRGKAIRQKCLDCCCGNSAEVRRCQIRKCALWRYRMGSENKAENKPLASDSEPKEQGV